MVVAENEVSAGEAGKAAAIAAAWGSRPGGVGRGRWRREEGGQKWPKQGNLRMFGGSDCRQATLFRGSPRRREEKRTPGWARVTGGKGGSCSKRRKTKVDGAGCFWARRGHGLRSRLVASEDGGGDDGEGMESARERSGGGDGRRRRG
jgi:hypothetical protein